MSMFERISYAARTVHAVPLLALALCAGAAACGPQHTVVREDSKPPEQDPCADAACTRTLAAGDSIRPSPEHGIRAFTVDRIENGTVHWTARFSGGNVAISASGARNTNSSCMDGMCRGKFHGSSGTLKMNDVTVRFVDIAPDSVTVRLSHPAAGR